MVLVFIIIALIIAILIIGIQGLIYWGIGSFICWAFNAPFEFTYPMGLAVAFIVSILTGIFKREVIFKNE